MAKRPKMKFPAPLGSILRRDMGSTALAERLREIEIWRIWPQVVGETVASRATPLRIIKGVLTVAVSSGPWMQELRFMTQMMREKLNQALGAELVTSIVLKTGARPPQVAESGEAPLRKKRLTARQLNFINEQSAALPDPELQQVFAELMKASYQASR